MCDTEIVTKYDLPMHFASIVILLCTSWLGTSFPIFAKRQGWTKLGFPLQVGKFFGVGVITATGFVHIFPDALSDLTNPCLSTFWTTTYPPAAGFFALFAALFIHGVEYLALQAAKRIQNNVKEMEEVKIEMINQGSEMGKNTQDNKNDVMEEKHQQAENEKQEKIHSHDHDLLILDTKNRIELYLLEFAIAIHSIIIGADLGVAGSEFETLLVALIFHQCFEGMGLGYRISDIKYNRLRKFLANAVVYSITTPIGVIIGIGLHHSSAPDSPTQTLIRGILNSLAGGILIYTSLVTLIAEECSSSTFNKLSLQKRAICFGSLYLGAIIMSVIGFWA